MLDFELTQEKVKKKELMHFTRQLAVFVKAGIPLTDALVTIGDETEDVALRRALGGMIDDLRNGGLLSVTAAMMIGLLILSRRAERVAYSRIEGQPGAVGAVVTSAVRRGWRTSEIPVAVNPRTRDAIYRCVGSAGVVLIAEGSRNGTKTILDEEVRKLKRATPGVSIHVFYVTGDESGTPLAKLGREITGLKRTLNRSEVSLVNARLQAMGTKLPIPKGIDPKRIRPVRR